MSETEKSVVNIETLTSLAKRRGFVFQSSEIYGGLSGFWDFGPYGTQMVRNIKQVWWDSFVRSMLNIHGLDGAIVQNAKLWEASGHVAGFNDPLVDCKKCQTRQRADHVAGVDSSNLEELNKLLADKACPNCGEKGQFSPARDFNMMFKTYVGPLEDEDSLTYLRPETAGAIFTNFELVRETTRAKLPFGIAQIGKAFRNEIRARDFVFRIREFEQMEIEYFVYPEQAEAELKNMKEICWQWLLDLGLDPKNLQWHQHDDNERAHYAADSWDIQYKYSFGFKELWGIANRTDYDLKAHAKASGKELTYFDQESNAHIVPFVIEPSIGISRLFMALLTDAYHEEEVNGEKRVVLKLDPKVAPIDVAVLPLSKKPELSKVAKEVYQQLVDQGLTVEYDESQSIGKRYRRQDEIGTPKCVTIDFDSLEDQAVTVRDRDTMEQERIKIADLATKLVA